MVEPYTENLMFTAVTIIHQDSDAILKKFDRAVYAVRADDKLATGFVIGNGKYLVTRDHVIGSDSKISILEPKAPSHFGYLVFHNSKLDIAVYRMDRIAPVSFKVNSDAIQVGKPFFVMGNSRDLKGRAVAHGTLLSVQREGDGAYVEFSCSSSWLNSGCPMLNAKGEVIGMTQSSDRGLSGYSITQFLKDQTVPPDAPTVVGDLGQVLDTTRVCESADLDSRTLFFASPFQYLLVNDFSPDFLSVSLPNGTTGYIRTSMVKIVVPNVTTGTPGIVNGFEVTRVVKTVDPTNLKASSSVADWQKETVRFVNSVFTTAGRELSDDLSVQLDIGRPVESIDDLQQGDRIYFGKGNSLWAAIFIGNGEYISVNKAGKLITSKFGTSVSKPFYRALH